MAIEVATNFLKGSPHIDDHRIFGLAPKGELLRSLGRLVRGLSALFWGLPLTLVVYVQTAQTHLFNSLGWFAIFLPVLTTAFLLYGLFQMTHFQKQERVWMRALERTAIIGWVNLGLSPFLYFWNKVPMQPFFIISVALLALSSLLFLFNLNQVLQRLSAMLPDETLRMETRMFTSFNRLLLISVPILLALYFAINAIPNLPNFLLQIFLVAEFLGLWLILFLVLMPVAMTMAMIWKIKEVIFASVFDAEQ